MKYPVKNQVSAGGVVYRQRDHKIEIVLIQPKDTVWCLPKGLIEPGENVEG